MRERRKERERQRERSNVFIDIFFFPSIYFISPPSRMSSRFWQFPTAGNRDGVCGFKVLHTFSPASRANCGFEAITELIIAWNVIIIVATHREKEASTIIPACNFAPFLSPVREYFSISNGNLVSKSQSQSRFGSFNTIQHLARTIKRV